MLVSLPTTEDPILPVPEPSRVLLHQRPHGVFLGVGKLGCQAASTGRRTGSCCCSCCRSAISVGEAWWSGPLKLPQCQTAPLHCPSASQQLLYTVPVPPDRSSTLFPGWCVTLLLPILLASTRFWRGAGVGSEGSRLEA